MTADSVKHFKKADRRCRRWCVFEKLSNKIAKTMRAFDIHPFQKTDHIRSIVCNTHIHTIQFCVTFSFCHLDDYSSTKNIRKKIFFSSFLLLLFLNEHKSQASNLNDSSIFSPSFRVGFFNFFNEKEKNYRKKKNSTRSFILQRFIALHL